MRRLCTICARGGSKGIPNKNLRSLGGRPLIAWTVLQAKACGRFEHIAVSSDAPAILAAAIDAGADLAIERPGDMATDTAAKVPAIRHAVLDAERRTGGAFDVVVDLDVTAPLRLPQDICGAMDLLTQTGASNVITGTPARRSPYFNQVERDADGLVRLTKRLDRPIVRRQDAPECFDMNASIYVWCRDRLVAEPKVFYADTVLYEMSAEHSHDIDTELDFLVVEFLFGRLRIADHLSAAEALAERPT